MTSSLRRKRRIIHPRTTPISTAISALILGWLASSAPAQPPLKPLPASITGEAPARTMYYQKATGPAATATNLRPTDWQDPQPDSATIPLPPSVLNVIKRSELESVDPKELFQLRTEAEIRKEVVAESGTQSIFGQFPKYEPLTIVAFKGRSFEPFIKYVEPNYVCHRRLYFEEKNAERQGWELGPLQPITSTMYFLADFFALPYNFATRPCDRWECSAGKCMPGDPTPYLLYPVEFSVTGGLFQAGTIIGLAAIIP